MSERALRPYASSDFASVSGGGFNLASGGQASIDEDARDHVRRLRDTPAYARSCRERKKVEMLFAHLKRKRSSGSTCFSLT
jgi:hypothetical protein